MNRTRSRIMNACLWGLRVYTRHAPVKRGRGLFIRAIELLKRRGWPPPLIPIADDLVMEFEPSLLGWTIFERGEWEPEQTRVILSHVQAASVVLNIGANTGYYALLAARKAGPKGHVYAFEIQPAIADILRRNVKRNGMEDVVTIVEKGCFSKDGEAWIESRGDPGSARVSFDPAGTPVPLITVDHFADNLDRVDLMIIDAEGADFEILKGSALILARHHPKVIAEAHHLATFGGAEEEMRSFMERMGYEARALQGEFSRDLLFL